MSIHGLCVNNKTIAIHDFIMSENLDVLAVTESWLKSESDAQLERIFEHELMPKTHHMIHVPRPDERKGGGIAVFHRKSIKVNITKMSGSTYKEFEYAVCSVNLDKALIRLIILYRPVPTKANKLNVKRFWKEFEKFLGSHACCKEELIVIGDLNFHLDKPNHPDTLKLNLLLEEFDLIQKINVATHCAGHTLDILVVRTQSNIVHSFHVMDPGFCNDEGKEVNDHYAVHFTLSVKKPPPQTKKISFRDIKSIDMLHFMKDLESSELATIDSQSTRSTSELVQLYNETFANLLDKFAPVKTKVIRDRPETFWFNEEIRDSKRERRQSERLWRKTGLAIHHAQYKQKCANTSRLIARTKLQKYSDGFSSCGTDQKAIHNLANSLFGGKPKGIIPTAECHTDLANNFMKFFCNKVSEIRQDLCDQLQADNEFIPVISRFDSPSTKKLSVFAPTTAEEVKDIILSSNNKTCELDPIATSFVKKCINLIKLPIATIINKSFEEGIVPSNLKKAIIRPVIKKPSLDPENISNYRPVSNLSFLSKVLEKAVNVRLDKHLEANNLLDSSQSAYRENYSTETVLVKILNDVLLALDQGLATILVMLDVSAAFDVVDHQRLLERHNQYFGMTEKALAWMDSYLNGRMQTVCIEGKKSPSCYVTTGFPQGSILGGKKFNMYSAPVGNVIKAHNLEYKYYADDGQEYVTFNLKNIDDVQNAISSLELSLADVYSWMTANMLKLNSDKTEVILFAPKRLISQISVPISVHVHGEDNLPEPVVKNLGVMLDSSLNMQRQISKITKSCYYQLRRISRVRKYLTMQAAKSLVNALVLSKLDYCNSLLVNLPKYLIKKLQKIQNYAVRVIKRVKVRQSVRKHLKDLHWLPVEYRIQFKVALLTYKSLNNLAPLYLKDMLQEYSPVRTLRSSSRYYLTRKRHLNHYGSRVFSVAAPKIWNSLPNDLRKTDSLERFKANLKTHFFRIAHT